MATLASHALARLRTLHARHAARGGGGGGGSGGGGGGGGALVAGGVVAGGGRGTAHGLAEGLCAEGEALLLTRALTLALRYRSIGGAGFQAGLGRPVFDALREAVGVSTEVRVRVRVRVRVSVRVRVRARARARARARVRVRVRPPA